MRSTDIKAMQLDEKIRELELARLDVKREIEAVLSELADEAHLHFAIKVNGVSVNPLDYLSEDSKSASLGL